MNLIDISREKQLTFDNHRCSEDGIARLVRRHAAVVAVVALVDAVEDQNGAQVANRRVIDQVLVDVDRLPVHQPSNSYRLIAFQHVTGDNNSHARRQVSRKGKRAYFWLLCVFKKLVKKLIANIF